MQVRCHNCGQRFTVPAADPAREVLCPSCGFAVFMALAAAKHDAPPRRPETEPDPRRAKASLRRVFEPIPRPLAYLAGVVVILVIMAPFWLYLLKDSYGRRRIVPSDDTSAIAVPPVTSVATMATSPVFDDTRPPAITFDQYHGVRLDASRDDLQRRFNLRLQNTRGMEPEIYEAYKVGDVEQMTVYFYGNLLKEFVIVHREKRAAPDAVEKVLVELFGQPEQRNESNATAAATPLSSTLPGLGVGENANDPTKELATFPLRRELVWSDANDRVEATIYYTSSDPGLCVSMLSMHVSAASWLKSNHPLIGSVPPPVTNSPEQPSTPAEQTQPKRLFP
jgi:DNA-directed RNA polymerase subunit RPC12/RpoP